MKIKYIYGVLSVFAIMLIIQLVFFNYDNSPVVSEPSWNSAKTKQTFDNLCADCHSNYTRYPWYSYVPPISFLVQYDIMEGREKFNVSEYKYDDGIKAAYEFKRGEMPMRIYTLIHDDPALYGKERDEFIKDLEATFGKYTREKLEHNIYSHPEE
jgi:hypothetical protein